MNTGSLFKLDTFPERLVIKNRIQPWKYNCFDVAVIISLSKLVTKEVLEVCLKARATNAISVLRFFCTIMLNQKRYSKSMLIRNSSFSNQAVQLLVHERVFQIGWFLTCHIRNSLIPQGFYCQEPFCHVISLN